MNNIHRCTLLKLRKTLMSWSYAECDIRTNNILFTHEIKFLSHAFKRGAKYCFSRRTFYHSVLLLSEKKLRISFTKLISYVNTLQWYYFCKRDTDFMWLYNWNDIDSVSHVINRVWILSLVYWSRISNQIQFISTLLSNIAAVKIIK